MLTITPTINRPEDFKLVLDELTEQLMNTASTQILDAGDALWLGLSLIVISWTGLRIAFSGEGWNAWEVIRLIIVLSIPRGMLEFYDTPFPGLGLTFPQIIVNQGTWLNGIIIADTGSAAWDWLQNYLTNTFNTVSDNVTQYYGLGLIAGVMSGGRQLMFLFAISATAILTLISMLIGYSFVIFSQLAISLLTLLGPLFIPWLVFPALSFLFWSWFRMLITYSLYAAIAAAVFRITIQLIMAVGNVYQDRANVDSIAAALQQATSSTGTGLGEFIVWSITFVLALLTTLLATFKIPELAGGLVTGAAPGGSIAGQAIGMAGAAKGGAAVSKVTGKAAGG
ncbi:MAG: type IV secretion system protein [Bryobacterales bacterium]|nr:type IV secretion system protein [Bryobacterales bacterium]